MTGLILSILLNTTIFILFRLLAKFSIKVFPVILINYLVCSLLGIGIVAFNRETNELLEWNSDYLYALGLGVFFILTFFLMAQSTLLNGTGITSMFSKMSVLIPVLAAVFFLDETLTAFKLSGMVLALIGTLIILYKKEKHQHTRVLLLMLVFTGSGLVDTGLNLVKSKFLFNKNEWVISTLIFCSAFVVGLLFAVLNKKEAVKPGKKEIVAGTILGIINLFSIVSLLMAVGSFKGNTGWLFVINNISIVMLSYIVSVIVFKEKINLRTALGILMVLAAMVLLNN